MKELLTVFLLGVALATPLLAQRDLSTLAFEGTCTEPDGLRAPNLDIDWICSHPRFYISYGSLQFWVQQAQVCLGSNPLTLAVLASMELKTHWNINSTTTCYGRSYSQKCSPHPNFFIDCSITRADPGINTAPFGTYRRHAVLTDNKTFALETVCANGLRSYYLMSPTPGPISQANLSAVIAKIIELGFDISLLTRIQNKEVDYLPNSRYKY